MLFQSQIYVLAFLPLTVALYYATRGSAVERQWVLIAASLFFYGWWDPRFVILVVSQITATWLLARAYEQDRRKGMARCRRSPQSRLARHLQVSRFPACLVRGCDRHRAAARASHSADRISFFSFQLISYLVDRMRGNAPLYPFRPFALFVLVFPHVIAGPIVRHNELVPQFALDPLRDGMWARIGAGLVIFTVGFARRCCSPTGLLLWSISFSRRQRSACSISAKPGPRRSRSRSSFFSISPPIPRWRSALRCLFGLVLPENFRRPYLATDLRDFWRRWHISLSNFLRDYLYIPARRQPARSRRAMSSRRSSPWACAACGTGQGGPTCVGPVAWHLADRLPRLAAARAPAAGCSPAGRSRCCSCSSAGSCSARADLPPQARSSARSQASWIRRRAGRSQAHCDRGARQRGHSLGARDEGSPAAADAGRRGRHALLAAFCVFEVGKGAPVNFIYFQF
jgi:hypothetical protein